MNCNNKNGLVGFCICCVKGVQFKNFFQKWSDFEEFGNGGTKKMQRGVKQPIAWLCSLSN